MADDLLLRMEHISKRFPGVQALHDVSFEVRRGEILGLMGENGAGKSTLIKILSGVYTKDSGQIWWDNQPINPHTPQDARKLGISTIFQELALVPHLSVGENIFLNQEPRRIRALGMVDFDTMNREAERLLLELGIELKGSTPVRRLTVAARQMVEIAKAVSHNVRLILMDEPTSALSSKEADALFRLMRQLRDRGVSVVFVSHRLEEVLAVVERIIIMRDGQRVGTLRADEATEEKIIQLMVGRQVSLFPKEPSEITTPVLEVRNLSGDNGVQNVSFTVRRGEIVGLAGLIGAGRTETVRLICGIDRIKTGEILVEGKPVQITSPAQAIHYGIGWVPEDRKQHGLLLGMTVAQNTSLAVLRRLSARLGRLKQRQEAELASKYVEKLSIATPSIQQTVRNLSGGNQQKVVLAKWLSTEPRLLIMDEPTRGIDVGAKAEVHRLMSQLAQQGIGILMISSEMPEIMGMSDRVIVLCQGRVTGEFDREQMTQENIMSAATKFIKIDQFEELAQTS